MKYKIRVEYEVAPIRNLVVQCPHCGEWFAACDITDRENKSPNYNYELAYAEYVCPICKLGFGFEEGMDYEEDPIPVEGIHHGVLRKKVMWE